MGNSSGMSCCHRRKVAQRERIHTVALVPENQGVIRRSTIGALSNSGLNGITGRLSEIYLPSPRRTKEPDEAELIVMRRLVANINKYPQSSKDEVFVFMINVHQVLTVIKMLENNGLDLVPSASHAVYEDSNMCLLAFQKRAHVATYLTQPGIMPFYTLTINCFIGNHGLLINKLEELALEHEIVGHFSQDSMDSLRLLVTETPKGSSSNPHFHIVRLDAWFDNEELEQVFDMCKKNNMKFKFSLNSSAQTGEVFLVMEAWPRKIEYYVADVTHHIKNEKNFQSAMSEEITNHLSADSIRFFGFIENRNKETLFAVFGTDY